LTVDEWLTVRRLARHISIKCVPGERVTPADSITLGWSENGYDNELIGQDSVEAFLRYARTDPMRVVSVSDELLLAHPEVMRGSQGVLDDLVMARDVLFKASDSITGTNLAAAAENRVTTSVSQIPPKRREAYLERALAREGEIARTVSMLFGRERRDGDVRKVMRMINAGLDLSGTHGADTLNTLLFSRTSDATLTQGEVDSVVKPVVDAIIRDPTRTDFLLKQLQFVNAHAWLEASRRCHSSEEASVAVQSKLPAQTVERLLTMEPDADAVANEVPWKSMSDGIRQMISGTRVSYYALKRRVNDCLRQPTS